MFRTHGFRHVMFAAASGVALSLAASAIAAAQTAPAAEPAPAAEAAEAEAHPTTTIGEVVVVAQRRSQNIQNVPLAVTAASGAQLDAARVANVSNIQALSPSITFRAANFAATTGNIQIRGIGTTGNSRSFEGSVGVFVDGVYYSRSGQALSNFLDVDNLEILRGPQGTLFGKNTSAGALLLTSVTPSTTSFGGNIEADYGNYNYYLVKGALNLPINDDVALRVAATTTSHDGYFTNPEHTQRYNQSDNTGVKAQLLVKPTDTFKLRLIADYSQTVGNCCYGTDTIVQGPLQPLVNALTIANGLEVPSNNIKDNQAQINANTGGRTLNYGATLLVDWDVGPGTLHSITAARRFDSLQHQDGDFTGADILGLSEQFDSRFYSQEFTYSGKTTGAIQADYIFGVYYSDEDLDMGRALSWGSQAQAFWNGLFSAEGLPAGTADAASGLFSVERMRGTSRSASVFTHWDFKLNDQFHLLAGVRYGDDRKTGGFSDAYFRDPVFDPLAIAGVMPGNPYRARTTNDSVSGTLNLQYRPTSDVMLYLSYNRGFKAGGVNIDVNGVGLPGSILAGTAPVSQSPIFKPETTDAVEAGWKIDWLDGRARTNGAVFYDNISNLQVAQFLGLQFTVLNAPSAQVYGAEIDQLFKLTREISLTGAVTWLPEANYGHSPLLNYEAGGVPLTLSGRRFGTAPEVAITAGASIEHPIASDLAITGRVQVQYQSSVYTSTSTSFTQGGYALLNLNLGLKSYHGWSVELWGQNVTNTHYYTASFPNPLLTGNFNSYVGDPATYGVALRAKF